MKAGGWYHSVAVRGNVVVLQMILDLGDPHDCLSEGPLRAAFGASTL